MIRPDHLWVVYEVWGYCGASVRYIFGDVLGDETADWILNLLHGRENGMTQTDMNHAFSGHKSTAELEDGVTDGTFSDCWPPFNGK